MSRSSHPLVAAVLVAVVLTFAPRAASACGNEWRRIAPRVVALHEAEEALETDDLARARVRAREVVDDPKSDAYERRRGRRLAALAVARREEATADEVAWAARELRALAETGGHDDVTLEADLGEVLARDPRTRAEGRAVLERLAARDLLGSRHATTVLAVVRATDAAVRRPPPAVVLSSSPRAMTSDRVAGSAAALAFSGLVATSLAWFRRRRSRRPEDITLA